MYNINIARPTVNLKILATETMRRWIYWLSLATLCTSSPLFWSPRNIEGPPTPVPTTLIPLPGRGLITGGFLISRVNLKFFNNTCMTFAEDLQAVVQIARTLIDNKLVGTRASHIRQYGFMMNKLDDLFRSTIAYLTDLLLCDWEGRTEIWKRFTTFTKVRAEVFSLLKKYHTREEAVDFFDETNPLDRLNETTFPGTRDEVNETLASFVLKTNQREVNNGSLIHYLEEWETHPIPQARSPILIGLGLGFVGSLIASKIFGSNSESQINEINQNMKNVNRNVRLTNQRIDLLAENVAKSQLNIKKIIEQLTKTQDYDDLHHAIIFNFDQISASIHAVESKFKFAEIITTLLERGIIRPELIHLPSLKKIVEEGLKSFPDLEFPLEINRHHLLDITKLLQIRKVGHLHYLMVIPLTFKTSYKLIKIVPHPIKINDYTLGLPELKEILLIDGNKTYISTREGNLFKVSGNYSVLINSEPINQQGKPSCEWEAYKQNSNNMTKLCNYKKIGHVNDTVVMETPTDRLVYFARTTPVSIDCAGKTIRADLTGMHKFPLKCDIHTKDTYWAARQTLSIELNNTDLTPFYFNQLPVIELNDTSDMHTSLRKLIDELPKKGDKYTIDFDYYGLTSEQVQTYQVYSNTVIIIIVIINSMFIGFLMLKLKSGKVFTRGVKQMVKSQKLSKARDSVRKSLRRNKVRDSVRQKRTHLLDRITNNEKHPPRYEDHVTAEVNESNNEELYPVLPRYL